MNAFRWLFKVSIVATTLLFPSSTSIEDSKSSNRLLNASILILYNQFNIRKVVKVKRKQQNKFAKNHQFTLLTKNEFANSDVDFQKGPTFGNFWKKKNHTIKNRKQLETRNNWNSFKMVCDGLDWVGIVWDFAEQNHTQLMKFWWILYTN